MDVPDPGALEALYAAHYLALVRLAVHLVDDLESAEDVVQDVFAGLRGLPPEGDARRYLQVAVLNRARSALRRRKVARAFGARAIRLDDAEAADEPALRTERRQHVLAAVDRLPRRQREAVVLRYYEDLRVTDIADLLGVRVGAVSSALSRALTTLAVEIGADRGQ